jgi:hypothetical protein
VKSSGVREAAAFRTSLVRGLKNRDRSRIWVKDSNAHGEEIPPIVP